MEIIVVLAAVAAAAVAIMAGVASQRRQAAVWSEAGDALGLDTKLPSLLGRPRLTGTLGEIDVEVDVITRGSGNSRRPYTRFRVGYPDRGERFKLTRETGFTRFAKLFGAEDVQVGDDAFDRSFKVKADDPNRLLSFLTPALRATLLRLAAAYPSVVIEHDGIRVEHGGLPRRASDLTTTIRRLASAGSVLGGLSATAPDLDPVLDARRRGDLQAAAERIRDLAARRSDSDREDPSDLDSRILEAETLAQAGDREEAAARFDRLAREVPDDPEVAGWQQRLQTPAPATPAAGDRVDIDEMAQELFADGGLSFEVAKRFDAAYRGRPVRWEGTIKSIRRYDHDGDLGRGPGTKAVVSIATIDHDLYGESTVDAVFGLPVGTGEGLARHDRVAFEGVLARIDSMMRNVFVDEARLVDSGQAGS